MIDLGTFAVIAKLLVRYLGFLHGIMGSWGIAIILLTVTVCLLLMPLTIPQIRSSLAMRRLKPELDAINAKFADDAKMLATTQLYKKNNVQPLLGCLPALLQMPVWFALYTSLQTAMELYHEKFALWHDLSAADPRYILPLVLGATMFVQQKVTPMQMDSGAAEDDAVLHAGHVHGVHAVPAGRPRRVHAHQLAARHPADGRRRALLPVGRRRRRWRRHGDREGHADRQGAAPRARARPQGQLSPPNIFAPQAVEQALEGPTRSNGERLWSEETSKADEFGDDAPEVKDADGQPAPRPTTARPMPSRSCRTSSTRCR